MIPSGVITITTDFGHKGPFAGVMKGVILSRFPEARIVDLAHDIPAQWPPEAGFWVSRSYSWFPAGTVHMAIVDPGVGTEREILLVEADGHVFIAPDNGLLGQLLDSSESPRVFRLLPDKSNALQLLTPSATFHGRDIFAPWLVRTFVQNAEVWLVNPGIWTRHTSRSVAAGDIYTGP